MNKEIHIVFLSGGKASFAVADWVKNNVDGEKLLIFSDMHSKLKNCNS